MKKNSKQQTKQQQPKSQQTKQQPAKRPSAGKPRTPFVEQLETERKQMQQSNEISAVAGVDIGDKRSYVRLVGLDGELLEEIKIPTRPAAIGKYFRSWPRLRVVLETGGHTNWIRRLIAELDHEVLVADARQLRLISQSYAKNDRNDAYWLGELGRTNTDLLAPVEPRGQQVEQHRSWLQGRETLVGARTQLVNNVQGNVNLNAIRFGPCGRTKWAAAVRQECPAVLRTILKPLARIIAALTQEINELDRRLEKLGKEQYPATQLLRTVDGVGPLTSLAFVLELNNDVGRVKRSRQMGAVVGCRPKQRDSGESSPELGITKAGNPMRRLLLVQCSQRILGPFGVESDLRRWGLQLAARGRSGPSGGRWWRWRASWRSCCTRCGGRTKLGSPSPTGNRPRQTQQARQAQPRHGRIFHWPAGPDGRRAAKRFLLKEGKDEKGKGKIGWQRRGASQEVETASR